MADYTNIGIAIGFIVVLLIVSMIIRSKSKATRRADIHAVKILSSLVLSSKEKILLLEVKNQQLLVGVTANQISNLFAFDGKKTDLTFEDIAQWQPDSKMNMRSE